MLIRANVEPLEWESRFFNIPAALLRLGDDAPPLDETLLEDYRRLQVKIPASRYDWLDALQKQNFRLVETECDFLLPVPASIEDPGFVVANEADIEPLRQIASQVFVHSRFRRPWYLYEDRPRFYACWVESAVLGVYDDQCLVLHSDDVLYQGMITMRQLTNTSARIGVLAGRGVGAKLIAAAQHWCIQRNISQLFVATQAANLAAMRRYTQSGGIIRNIAYWLYR